jgi:hypothetical protein
VVRPPLESLVVGGDPAPPDIRQSTCTGFPTLTDPSLRPVAIARGYSGAEPLGCGPLVRWLGGSDGDRRGSYLQDRTAGLLSRETSGAGGSFLTLTVAG